MKKEAPIPPLEAGLLTAMRALDNQVARAMQRSPSEIAAHGVQKWEPYQQRVESLSSFFLEALGKRRVELDSLLIMAQAFSKALGLYVQEMEEKGLGKMRSQYCRAALDNIGKDIERGLQLFKSDPSGELM